MRRHHTISASSRTAHAGSRTLSDESQQGWNDDEVVDQEWVGFVGAVGDKSNLHRQASLPTRYNRGTVLNCLDLLFLHNIIPNYNVSFRW